MDSSIAKRGQKMLKKVIFIICLLLLLLSMASVSASDMENSTILADYDSSDEILKSDEVNSNDVVDASNNYDTLNEASFDILQDYIDTASEGAEISLSQDYSLHNYFPTPYSLKQSILQLFYYHIPHHVNHSFLY